MTDLDFQRAMTLRDKIKQLKVDLAEAKRFFESRHDYEARMEIFGGLGPCGKTYCLPISKNQWTMTLKAHIHELQSQLAYAQKELKEL